MAASTGFPSERSRLIKEIITNPFKTATPERAMNPTPAEMDNGMPRSHKERMPQLSI
jgi:hypothetical protein